MGGISALSANTANFNNFGSNNFNNMKINSFDKTDKSSRLLILTDNALQNNNTTENNNKEITDEADIRRRFDSFECQTCKNRRYQNKSDDSGVSFQTPTKVNPAAAESAVRAHENEHVTRNQAKAEREGDKIVSQSVTIQRGICPECGKVYVSGGVTKTSTKSAENNDNKSSSVLKYTVGMNGISDALGKSLSTVA